MFQNKVVVITGAGSGIGRALALEFARKGAHLALSDINMDGLDDTLQQLHALTSKQEASPTGLVQRFRAYRLDASSWEGFQQHAAEVKTDFGTAHVIVNNAGATVIGTVANTTIEEYRWQLDLNMYGVLYGSKAFMPMMLAQREGWIVNISSIFGLLAYPCQSAYNMSKFAVRGLTECLWQELEGTGVQAVCVHPGGIRTNIEKGGRRVKAAGATEAEFAAKAERLLLTPPEECAADIVAGMVKGKRRIITGHRSSLVYWLARLLPNSYPAVLRRV